MKKGLQKYFDGGCQIDFGQKKFFFIKYIPDYETANYDT